MIKLLLAFCIAGIIAQPVQAPSYSVGVPTTTYPVIFALDSAGTTVYDTTSVSIFGYNPDTATAFRNRAITEQNNYNATH